MDHDFTFNLCYRIEQEKLYLLTKKTSIFQGFIKIVHITAGIDIFPSYSFDPFQTFLRKIFAVFTIDL